MKDRKSVDEQFEQWIDEKGREILAQSPIICTFFGIHDFSDEMGDPSMAQVEKNYQEALQALDELHSYNKDELHFENQVDYQLLEDLVALVEFHHNRGADLTGFGNEGPVGTCGMAVFSLLTRDFAPLPTRLGHIVARIEKMPEYLECSKDTWVKPVKLFTQIAMGECDHTPGMLQLVQQILNNTPGVPEEVENRAEQAIPRAIEAMGQYKTFLEQEVMPRADNTWVMGEEDFATILKLRRLPLTAEEIVQLGEQLFEETHQRLTELARQIDSRKSLDEVREMVKGNHPTEYDTMLEDYRKSVAEAREFVLTHGIATIPDNEFLEVIETPSYMTPIIPFAAYVMPSHYDAKQVGHYIVTRPRQPSMFAEHSYSSIANVSVHEAYPGHHLQNVVSSQKNSIMRKLQSGIETVEGWAHYCEQMMREEGYIESLEAEFAQELDVLWRAARMIIDVKLSTGQMTIGEAVEELVQKIGMDRQGATAEVTRYACSPGYPLSYLLGKKMMLELRDKVKTKLGQKYDQKDFHDLVLKSGGIPFHYVEQIVEHYTNSG